MSNNKSRNILETSLALLLGFEVDDVVDVIDHLLTFDSKEDLLEHITALLGRNDNDVLTFVENIIKFQNGQDLDDGGGSGGVADCNGNASSDSKESSGNAGSGLHLKKNDDDSRNKSLEEAIEKQRQEEERIKRDHEERKRLEQRKKKQQQKQHRQMNGIKVKNAGGSQKKNQGSKSKVSSSTSSGSNSVAASSSSSPIVSNEKQGQSAKLASAPTPSANTTSSTSKKSNNTFEIVKPKIQLPPKGKATIICGCFGTIHPYVANCLHCGYILCQKEGYGYCPHCSNLVSETIINNNGNNLDDGMIKAILHKERLLDFDRNSASRTKVYDSQSDYYSSSTSNWLTETEQKEAALKEEERVKEIHSIRHVLELNIE